MAAVGITNQWATAKNGVIEIPQKDNEIEATHTILLVGYDDSSGYLTFRNSWGTEWGDKGYGYLPYGYFESQLVSAWVMYYWRPSKLEILHSEYFSVRSVQLTCTKIDSIVGKALILFDLHDLLARKKIGWCFVVPRDDWLNVEEMFVVPSYRNKGYGKILCDGLLSLSSEIWSPLRLWISYADDVAENQKCVSWVSSYLRLHLRSSEVRWASLRAEPSKQQNRMRVKIECPSRPRSYLLTKNRE
jgi:GNAT superfamily N-acetyltransferase